MLKSISTSVAFPAYALGLDPTRRFICISYSGELAKKHSNDFRAVIEAPWYRSAFPTTRIGPKNSETEIELTERDDPAAFKINPRHLIPGPHI